MLSKDALSMTAEKKIEPSRTWQERLDFMFCKRRYKLTSPSFTCLWISLIFLKISSHRLFGTYRREHAEHFWPPYSHAERTVPETSRVTVKEVRIYSIHVKIRVLACSNHIGVCGRMDKVEVLATTFWNHIKYTWPTIKCLVCQV